MSNIVIRRSDDDKAHYFVDTIPAGFELITAPDIVETGATAKGLEVTAIWSQESPVHKDIPRHNATYRFTLDRVTISHMGDVGDFLTKENFTVWPEVEQQVAIEQANIDQIIRVLSGCPSCEAHPGS